MLTVSAKFVNKSSFMSEVELIDLRSVLSQLFFGPYIMLVSMIVERSQGLRADLPA